MFSTNMYNLALPESVGEKLVQIEAACHQSLTLGDSWQV